MSRSGSTLLSHRIQNSTQEVLVLPESKTLEILYILGNKYLGSSTPEKILEHIENDPRWQNLEINRNILLNALSALPILSIQSVFEAIIQYKLNEVSSPIKYVLLKNGHIMDHIPSVLKLFPQSYFLHIHRDPRGVISSMLKAKSPFFSGKRFAHRNARMLSKYYAKYRSQFHTIDSSDKMEVSYEALCNHERETLDGIAEWLNVGLSTNTSSPLISEAEKEIHALVDKDIRIPRLHAWKTELKESDGVVVESILPEYIDRPFFNSNPIYKAAILFFQMIQEFFIKLWLPLKSTFKHIRSGQYAILWRKIFRLKPLIT